MGINLEWMLYLQNKGYLNENKNKLLDIGSQNIYYATHNQICAFVKSQGASIAKRKLKNEIDRLIYFSTPRAEERTTLLSELTDLTNIEYNSFDICPALKTDIIDLNFDSLPIKYAFYYDVILNFGTSDHVFNQWNTYQLMHEATKVGGVFYHQLPGSGYLDHGYFCYTPLFFKDLAKANDYEILDLFFTEAGKSELHQPEVEVYNEQYIPFSSFTRQQISCFNINVIMRKTNGKPFRCPLEITASHSPINADVANKYASTSIRIDILSILNIQREKIIHEYNQLISSKSWRMTEPLRYIMRLMKKLT